MRTITFVGNGNMGLSIAQGLKGKYHIEVVGRNMKNLDTFEEKLGQKINKFLIDDFSIAHKTILLCVKPGNIVEVSNKLQGKADLLISVLAGVPTKSLKKHFKAKSIIRSMPNLAASVGKSITSITGDLAGKEEATVILNAIGNTLWLESEKEIDIATALAGSGPAYLALIAEAFVDGAVKQGLQRENATIAMQGLFSGFSSLVQEMTPSTLKDNVMSPGGTTAAGYSALEKGNVRASCMNAIQKAYKKAEKLSH
ncbi:MAG: pyrroline-5-carboxylate reductase [Sulfurovum sp.]|nr:MAG: pyrroline-5-carboxylate reductase [Sulfurovum sp.]RUM72407.1 MAG: pyrroline-5-carboxylate reductase [Sulfurovum sp.]